MLWIMILWNTLGSFLFYHVFRTTFHWPINILGVWRVQDSYFLVSFVTASLVDIKQMLWIMIFMKHFWFILVLSHLYNHSSLANQDFRCLESPRQLFPCKLCHPKFKWYKADALNNNFYETLLVHSCTITFLQPFFIGQSRF